MGYEGIRLRRSSRLVPSEAPPSPPSTETPSPDVHIPDSLDELPDLGSGVELVALPDTEIDFDATYLTSQEHNHDKYSDYEHEIDEADSEEEIGGGLEEILWPLELLNQAGSYGLHKCRKRPVEYKHSNRRRREDGASTSHAVDNAGEGGIWPMRLSDGAEEPGDEVQEAPALHDAGSLSGAAMRTSRWQETLPSRLPRDDSWRRGEGRKRCCTSHRR